MITLRAKEPRDKEFLVQLYASTRTEELSLVPWSEEQKKRFLRMQFEAQTAHYRNVFPRMSYQIILDDGKNIGRLLCARLEDEIRIVDISLIPEFRGRGISSALIAQIMNDAQKEAKCVRLHVSTENPAKKLYERLGFKELQRDGFYIFMEAKPEMEMQK